VAVLATGMTTLVAQPSPKDQAAPPPALALALAADAENPPPPKVVLKPAREGDTVTLNLGDIKTKAPLPGVELKVRIGGKETSTATSDAQGHFSLKLPSPLPKMLGVRASKDGYAPVILSVIHPAFEDPFPLSYDLAMVPIAPISGIVRDEDGKPVSGVEVTPTFWNSSLAARNREQFDVEHSVKTDDQGHWQNDVMPSAIGFRRFSSISLRFTRAGFQMVEKSGNTPEEAIGRDGILVLPKGLSIPGRVVDNAGKPIKGASITLRHPDRFGDNILPLATSDAGGLFQLEGVPPGELLMTTRVDGYAPDLRRVKVAKGIPSSEIRLSSGRTIRGLVQDDKGKPIGHVTIYLDGWRGERASDFRIESGADGRFVWEHAPDDAIWLDVMTEGFLPARSQEVGPKENEKSFTLHRIPSARGTVVDAETGRPIESFRIIPGSEGRNGAPTYWDRGHDRAQVSGKYEIKFTESASSGRRLRVEAEGYRPEVSRRFLDREERVEINFTLRKESGVSGIVQLPDGSPLAGAEILQIGTSQPAFLTNGHTQPNNDHRVVKSGHDGHFMLPTEEPPYTLLALHDRGFAELRVEKAGSTTPPMTVEPWGRVEGTLRIGSKPGAAQDIHLLYERQGDSTQAIPFFSGRATTDASGRFVFERALPGKGSVARSIPLGRMRTGYSHSTPVQIRANQTTRVAIGGVGRPLIGRVVMPADRNAPVDWSFGLGSIMTKPSLSQRLGLLATRSYTAKIEPDGTFRTEDVEPGSYTLILSLEAPPSNPNGLGFNNNNLGAARREFDIPTRPGGRSDDPFDLGTIELVPSKPQKVIKVSEVAPTFQVETLDGTLLSLADYRGRFVLLDFWATWCGPCLKQTPHLKAAFEEFGKDDRFAMIGLSLDESRDRPKEYVEKNALGWTQGYLGPWAKSKVPEDFGVTGIPSIWLIGPDGRVVARDLDGTGIKEAVADALSSTASK
ncbi:carboxypeptidase regulatory-like domain-containing protein, partial [Singulisphaera rosea]